MPGSPIQTVTTSLYWQWYQWSPCRDPNVFLRLLSWPCSERSHSSVCFGFSPKCSENKMVFWKILHFTCVEPCLCLCSSSLTRSLFASPTKTPQTACPSPGVTSWCHIYLRLTVCLCEFILWPSLHPLLFWRLISNVANCCLFSFPCLITLVEFAHAVTSLSPGFVFSLGFSSSRCLLLFNFAPVSGLDSGSLLLVYSVFLYLGSCDGFPASSVECWD